MEVQCKVLKAEDSRVYRELRLESLRKNPEAFGSDYQTQSQLSKLFFEEVLETGSRNNIMLGALCEGKLVGLCGLISQKETKSLELVQMFVAPECRGQSIGKALLSKAESILQSRHEDSLTLTVYTDNEAAIRAYESFGFTKVFQHDNEIMMKFQ
ncbi:GNAT family N-acetyltransferase [Vibrio astriarenae]|uniref:GNAT family N-acetyltransferase n=1 Tax=Vibrio astriarenae TaxID=1481923 RepID=UPI003734D70B